VPKKQEDIGRFKRIAGQSYKLKATSRTKGPLQKLQRRWGFGRILRLPKGNLDYQKGDRWGLYLPG